MTEYVAPTRDSTGFHCPHCGFFADQVKHHVGLMPVTGGGYSTAPEYNAHRCAHCHAFTVWHNDAMVYPFNSAAPLPSPDMPPDVATEFLDARKVLQASAPAAAALLRLALQRLCKELGLPGKNINDDVAALVRRGLPQTIQQALDVVRVVGNNAVHPGEIDLRDDPEIALALFTLVNLVVDSMISQPKQVTALYSKLPQSAIQAIGKRDS